MYENPYVNAFNARTNRNKQFFTSYFVAFRNLIMVLPREYIMEGSTLWRITVLENKRKFLKRALRNGLCAKILTD